MLRMLPGLLLLASCAVTPINYPDDSALIDSVEIAQDIWRKQSIINYRFVRRSSSFGCGTPAVVVTVRQSQVRSVLFDDDHTDCQSLNRYKRGQDASTAYPSAAESIDDLFEDIYRLENIGVVEANFHPVYGIPVSIRFNNPHLEDDFALISIAQFEYSANDD